MAETPLLERVGPVNPCPTCRLDSKSQIIYEFLLMRLIAQFLIAGFFLEFNTIS